MRLALLAIAAAMLATSPAHAFLKAGRGVVDGPHRLRTAAAIPIGDLTAFTVWWGLRAYNSSKCTGSVKAVRLRRASDSLEADITIGTDCNLNMTAANAHCANTSCSVRTLYDQVAGNACNALPCDLATPTAAQQYEFRFNCVAGRPCIVSNAGFVLQTGNNTTPATGVVSFVGVGARLVGGGTTCPLVRQNGVANRMLFQSNGQTQLLGGTSGSVSGSYVSDGTFVAIVGAVNGAASGLNTNGTDVLGTTTGNVVPEKSSLGNGNATNLCASTEGGFADNAAWSAALRGTLAANMRAAGGF